MIQIKNNISEMPLLFDRLKKVVLFSPTLNIIEPKKQRRVVMISNRNLPTLRCFRFLFMLELT